MKFTKILVLAFLFIPSALLACPVSPLNKPYKQSRKSFFYEADFLTAGLTGPAGKHFALLNAHQKSIREKTNTNAYVLLKKQSRFYASAPVESRRFKQLITKKIGDIVPLNCLEGFLFDSHLSQFPKASEFAAFILVKADKTRVLVYTQANPQSVGRVDEVDSQLNQSLREGWILQRHLHNHPFSFNNPHGDVSGTVIPSQPDINLYLDLIRLNDLEFGSVSNGFDTLYLSQSELREF